MEAALLEAGCGPYPWHPEFKAVLQVITNTWTSAVMSFMAIFFIDLHHNIRMDGYVYSQQDVNTQCPAGSNLTHLPRGR
jgi:hypothetical protein